MHFFLKVERWTLNVGRFLLLSGFFAVPVFAQMSNPLPTPENIVAQDPYWRETVDRAIQQYQSENPEERRSAVMLLGKYPVPPAQETVAEALEDSDAGVRQAALVSVLEEQMQIHPAARGKLLYLLGDPSVSIRRIASSSLPILLSHFPFTMQPGAGQMSRQIPEEVTEILQSAFQDEDVSVRRNMVNNYTYLRIALPEETVVALLHDPDRQVAIHALQWALPLLTPQTLEREIEKLVEHEDPLFRLELARALQSRVSPALQAALRKLESDSHPPVALEAMLGLFNWQPDIERYEQIVQLFRQSRGTGDFGERVVFAAQMLGDEGEPFLRKWLDADDPGLRQQAARIYIARFPDRTDSEFLLNLLEDPVQGIRQQATAALMQKTNALDPEQLRAMSRSRFVDARRAAAELARFSSPEEAEEILLDLLLDHESTVQAAALQQIGQRRIDGWEEILAISLDSSDPLVSRTALQWLLRHPTPQTLSLLREFLDNNPSSTWRAQIETHIRRHSKGN